MISIVRKNLSCLILKHSSSPLSRSPVSFSLSLSASTKTQVGINTAVFDILRHKYKFPPELASRVASELTRLKNPEKADSILSFFKESGFSNTQLERIVKPRAGILANSLEDSIKPKFKFFQDLGFSSNDISELISGNPEILELSLKNNIIPSLSVLKSVFGSNNDVVTVIRKAPRFLTVNLRNNVVPNIEFLKSCGIPMERIRIILTAYPRCFLVKPEVMRKSAEKANKMGLAASSTNFNYAIPTIASMSSEAWEPKLQAFWDLGFSDSDVLTMFEKAPLVFYVPLEKIKMIKELLLATGKFNLSCIVNYPNSLGFSIDEIYKPRLQILGILESKNLIEKWPCLGTICVSTDNKFYKKFIRPYINEVGDVEIIKNFSRSKKEIKAKS